MFKPESFDEIFGQDHIVTTLKGMEFGGKTILFEGIRGTGKTSLAHIIANMFADSKYNILHVNCGEIGKDEIIGHIKTFNKSTVFGKRKVYIFDEPQVLHDKALSSLLVPTEKINNNALVILCSMEPEKIKVALSDRFIRFRTRPLDDATSMEFINFLCKRNSIELNKFKRVLLTEKCDGNPRLIVNAIPKIELIHNKEDIEYLLDLNAVEEDKDVLQLFQVILADEDWLTIRNMLNNLLKTKSPNTIRVGILNLIGNGLLKGFGAGKEKRLIHMFNILEKPGIPERAHLIAKIGEIVLGERWGV